MHELRVATEILDIVEKEMHRQQLMRLESVTVRVGALTGINADALAFGFEASIAETPLDGARLIVEPVPVRARCGSCGKVSNIESFIFVCGHCSSTDLEVIEGEELYIDHLVGE